MVSDKPSASRLDQYDASTTGTSSEATTRHGLSGARIEYGEGQQEPELGIRPFWRVLSPAEAVYGSESDDDDDEGDPENEG